MRYLLSHISYLISENVVVFSMNILFTCGGTAGHINPAVALARMFQERVPDCRVLFVGADGGMETRLVPQEGFDLKTVTITSFYRSLSPAAIKHDLVTLVNLSRSRRQAAAILDEFKPDLVVGTGGYASFPAVKQAARMGIPTAIHESNAFPGLTTRTLADKVDLVMVGFPEAAEYYKNARRVAVTGTPVRSRFFQLDREQARAELGLTDRRPLVVSFWGSQGAKHMNGQTLELFERWVGDERPFHYIHSGGRNYEEMAASLKEKNIEVTGEELRPYIDNMPTVMAAADLVICRAGASTISELTAMGKPAILVPSPYVAANHQYKNAKVLADRGGVALLEEQSCSGALLYETALELLADGTRRAAMGRAMKELAAPNATEEIYQELLKILK